MSNAKTIKSIILKTDQRRLARGKATLIKLGVFVLLPTLTAFIYYMFIASNFYESEAQFKVHTGSGKALNNDLTAEAYILSREALTRLEKDFNFIASYQSKKVDFFNRLPEHANFEDAYQYYLKLVKISFDQTSGIATLKIKAPTPYKAKIYADALLKYSDDIILKLADKFRNEQLTFAKQELNNAESRLAVARSSLLKLEDSDRPPLNSQTTISNLIPVKISLEKELAQTKIKYNKLKANLKTTSPQLVALQHKINYLISSIEQENKKIADAKANRENPPTQSFLLEQILAERDFAEESYRSAINFLENSRNELLRQYHYLAIIVPPNMPFSAIYPNVFTGTLTVFSLTLALFGIFSLLIAIIREHVRI
ncbi:capsule polysaccharide export protein-like protein [endosymbiont of Acanthamoeba sp. UWC8]|uniref:hypothetical protein n=1 Tax=endosymbiont of Acanthamoeba sp. UWC8 TaxID=86106 RepID=UPI0004D15370|nr:hypothetical protein [endosymbiont of Acanthamoeba sp. UWC8]AIF80846.1 capsule polysaccharide export protein-like protein [endosymbiont of Acanthamoeba sp. UWC8]